MGVAYTNPGKERQHYQPGGYFWKVYVERMSRERPRLDCGQSDERKCLNQPRARTTKAANSPKLIHQLPQRTCTTVTRIFLL